MAGQTFAVGPASRSSLDLVRFLFHCGAMMRDTDFSISDPAISDPAGAVPGGSSVPEVRNRQPLAGAAAVARGISRLFARNGIWCLEEMALRGGRRADLMGIDAKGHVVIVEIKVTRADLIGDSKWEDYLDHCDRFFWGLASDIDPRALDAQGFRPDCCGVIVADVHDGEILRPAPLLPLAPARRKKEIEELARAALRRHRALLDPPMFSRGPLP